MYKRQDHRLLVLHHDVPRLTALAHHVEHHVVPVSYTHLDVYKRQEQGGGIKRKQQELLALETQSRRTFEDWKNGDMAFQSYSHLKATDSSPIAFSTGLRHGAEVYPNLSCTAHQYETGTAVHHPPENCTMCGRIMGIAVYPLSIVPVRIACPL